MSERETKFVDVILPLALPQAFTYRVPFEWNDYVTEGKRVIVQFGRGSKLYSGLIEKVHQQAPTYQAKYIDSVLDAEPIVHAELQFKFWKWIAEYYLCQIGEVMNAALPGGLRLASETRVYLHPEYAEVVDEISDKEYLIVEALELRNVLMLSEIAEILNVKNVHSHIKAMIEKKAIMVEEEIKQRYKPKMIDYVKLTQSASDEKRIKQIFDELERAPKQLEALMAFLQLNKRYSQETLEVKKLQLQKTANVSSAVINELQRKDILQIYSVEAGRLSAEEATSLSKTLSEDQEKALNEIKHKFTEQEVVLLFGVTSSGKTELYIKLIQEALERGEQVLYLLPEIALTSQIILRLQAIFGEKVGVYHSKFNENERVEVWQNVLQFKQGEKENFQIILGARSSLFLPYSNLGLVIVDEEHENTFKQFDPAPRYHARDAAIVLAKMQGAKVLLGSATPSVESYRNAMEGKYGLVELKKRHTDIQMPEILYADVKDDSRRKKMKSHFSPLLMEHMQESLDNKKQIILFQNRRGYSPILMCDTCGHSPNCANCDVTLTYHKFSNQLSCHYCGYNVKLMSNCNACGDTNMQVKGFGTEKIEEELAIFFPKARIARMDLDTTRAKNAYHQIIHSFQEHEIDILVGTQMVAKGLDFENVALVGIMNADNMLNFPDFRAFERSYQLMSQVSGRAGRKGKRGKVVIQTYNPQHQIIQQVINHDFEGMYKDEIIERRNFKYPPYYRLIKLTLRDRDVHKLNAAADRLTVELKSVFGERILGPEFPGVARVRNYYLKNIMLKVEKEASIKKAKEVLTVKLTEFSVLKDNKSIRIGIDVDPM